MSSQSSVHATSFSFRELANATKNFKSDNRLGEGGFGAVYKGVIEGTNQIVAVKQLNLKGPQGEMEFMVEVVMLSLLNHPNIVKMIGYCSEGEQRAIVYEFLPLGSLEDHLHFLKSNMQPLDWNTRMKIAAGIARGLKYLHHQSNPTVIYRDLKSSNILLDEGFHPKLSDFGLAKFGPHGDSSHISTRIMGTYGYCAPEYAATGRLTFMSDVYSFGIVLLELLTGLKAMDETRPSGQRMLIEWARPFMNTRNYVPLVDPRLNGKYPASALSKVVDVISQSTRYDAVNRPTMNQLVIAMDFLEKVVV